MKIRHTILAFICWMTVFQAAAQDLHSSQFYALKSLYNPAETGYFDEIYRIGASYRDQWGSVTAPYRSLGFFADAGFFTNRNFERNRLGFGLHLLSDKAGDGDLGVFKGGLTTAYHQSFDRKNKFTASIGFGLDFVQKNIRFDQLVFDNQWTDNGFNQNLPNGEPFTKDNTNYFDFSSGIRLTYKQDNYEFMYLSAALKHINRPSESFFASDNQLSMRPMIQAGGKFGLRHTTAIEPEISFSTQRGARELIVGTNISYGLGYSVTGNKLYFGMWYRYGDALIPNIGLEYKHLQFFMSYDVNVSKLSSASSGAGGLELSVIYKGQHRTQHPLDCPRY